MRQLARSMSWLDVNKAKKIFCSLNKLRLLNILGCLITFREGICSVKHHHQYTISLSLYQSHCKMIRANLFVSIMGVIDFRLYNNYGDCVYDSLTLSHYHVDWTDRCKDLIFWHGGPVDQGIIYVKTGS